jgi:O-antigen ligase
VILGLKELFCVLVIAAIVFWLAKPFVPLFITPGDFARRRNVWYALTVTAFISPSFWLFALIAIPVMAIAGRKDSNPSALYLMLLQVIPEVNVPVPMIGMPYLFFVNNYLLLSFCVMTPAALRIMRSKDKTGIQPFGFMDFCLLAYGCLTAVLYIHTQTPDGGIYPGSVTESLRRGFVFFFGIYIPYFAISRMDSNRRVLVDTMASFCLACALMAAIAVFESARHWLLYDMPDRWGYGASFSMYLARGSSLRAMASSGHSLALGHLLAMAFGFWLYLQGRVDSKRLRLGVIALFWAGLLAAYARGAWIAAVLIYFLFAALRPNPLSTFLKASMAAMVVAIPVYLSPLGDKIISVLPFLGGTVDNFNVIYRQRLWERSWQIIQENPIWGDPAAMLKMQDLRQGQGIIDLVNTYAGVLLGSGFIGLSLFLAFISSALFKTWLSSRRYMRASPDYGLLGGSLVSCILGTLLLIENGSFVGVSERMFYVIAALAAAYAYLGQPLRRQVRFGTAVMGTEDLPR